MHIHLDKCLLVNYLCVVNIFTVYHCGPLRETNNNFKEVMLCLFSAKLGSIHVLTFNKYFK